MNTRRDRESPWGVRVYFEPLEFEAMMQEVLLRAEPGVFRDGGGINVDLVLLKAFHLEADYVDLPPGVLGRTLFRQDGTPKIEVSRVLVEDAESDQLARRRLRTTLAHECGHVACHQQLFVGDSATLPLFAPEQTGPEKPAILCREVAVGGTGYRGDWWEFQANQCMAALLLPKTLFADRYRALLSDLGVPTFADALKVGRDEQLLRTLANTFDVSWQATLLRLQELGFAPRATGLEQRQMAL